MTATQTSSTSLPAYQVQRNDTTTAPGRISSIRRRENSVDYAVRTDAGAGGVVNLWTTSGKWSSRCPAGGASR